MRVLIDHSNIVHMAYHTAVNTYNDDPEHTNFLDSFIFTLRSKIRAIKTAIDHFTIQGVYEVVFVVDNNSTRKMELYPKYKAHREHNVDIPFEHALEYVRRNKIGSICHSPGNEADDAIATLCNEGENIVATMDRDMWQLIDYKNIYVLHPKNYSMIGPDEIEKAFGVTKPNQIALCKALWGDAGDGVPNAIPRMQKALIPLVRAGDGTLKDFESRLKADWYTLTKRCQRLWIDNADQVRLNWQLVLLDRACEIVWEE